MLVTTISILMTSILIFYVHVVRRWRFSHTRVEYVPIFNFCQIYVE